MNHFTKSKIIIYLALIFVAGGVTGAVIRWGGANEKSPRTWDHQKMCSHFRDRMQSELGLTAAQVQQLEPLLEKRVRGMEEIRSRTVKEIEELFRKSNEEIAAALQLTPAQQAKLEQMEAKRKGERSGGKRRESDKRHDAATNVPPQ
jgi:Spy/CpxP family protein refolding chaperone